MSEFKVLYVTQKSYCLSIRYFGAFFAKPNAKVIYVYEKNQLLKKVRDIRKHFGRANLVKLFFFEFLFLLIYFFKEKKIQSRSVLAGDLNDILNEELAQKKYDILFSIGTPLKIDVQRLNKFKTKMINLHGGITPFQVGKYSPIKALESDDSYLGCTIHLMSEKIDMGRILSQAYFPVVYRKIFKNYNLILNLSSEILSDFFENKYHKLPKQTIEYFNQKYLKEKS